MKYLVLAGAELVATTLEEKWAITIALRVPGVTHVVDETDTQIWPDPSMVPSVRNNIKSTKRVK